MIVYNGTQSNTLAGKLTGVLDNCFTVGWAGERGGSMEGRREREKEREKKAEGGNDRAEDREREQGMGSLEFVAHRISSGSLSPPRLVVWLFCYLPPYLIKTAIFGSVTTTTMSFIKRSSNSVLSPGLIIPCKQ